MNIDRHFRYKIDLIAAGFGLLFGWTLTHIFIKFLVIVNNFVDRMLITHFGWVINNFQELCTKLLT